MDATVGALAARLNGEVIGDPDVRIAGLNSLDEADSGALSFFGGDAKVRLLDACQATAILIDSRRVDDITTELRERISFIAVDDALASFLRLLQEERPARRRRDTGVSPAASVAASATIGDGTNIGANATVGEDAQIGQNCEVHPGAVIGDGCTIGDNTIIHPRVVLYPDVKIGNRVILHAGVVIGGDGFGYRFQDNQFQKLPHLGSVRIEDDVEIGANATVDRGMIGDTVIGQGTKLDNLVMVAHNCRVGQHNVFASQVGMAGSSSTGDFVRIGGQVGMADHIHLGSGVSVAAGSGLHKDIPDGETWAGYPARPAEETFRVVMAQTRLPDMRTKLRDLEKQVRRLTDELTDAETKAA